MAHMLRIRMNDSEPWGKPMPFRSKRERDKEAAFLRCIGGFRTHSWTETKSEEREGSARAARGAGHSGATKTIARATSLRKKRARGEGVD
jgi:hypothetical protein